MDKRKLASIFVPPEGDFISVDSEIRYVKID
jgi:hypothetical protein